MENNKIEKVEDININEFILYANEDEVRAYLAKLYKKVNEIIEVINNGK